MSTIAAAEEQMLRLLGYPKTDKPNRHQRLMWLNLAIDHFAKVANASTRPHLVDFFRLPVDSDTNEYAVPVDNFDGLYYCIADLDAYPNEGTREIQVINFPDSELYFNNATRVLPGLNARVSKMGWRGVGDSKRLVTFPLGASDQLIVWYTVSAPTEPTVQDTVFSLDAFHLGLIPSAAALMGMAEWDWNGMSNNEIDIKKQMLLDDHNPLSLKNYFLAEASMFEDRVHRPDISFPSAKLQGFASRRRARRRTRRSMG